MLRKHNHFLFKGSVYGEKFQPVAVPFEYQAQVLVCGEHAKDILAELDPSMVVNDGDKHIHAFRFMQCGVIHLTAHVKLHTQVTYEETRIPDAKPEITFIHQDDVTSSSNANTAPGFIYIPCEPDYQTNQNVFIVIASKDKESIQRTIDELDTKLAARASEAKLFIHHAEHDSFSAEDAAESLKKELNDSAVTHMKNVIKVTKIHVASGIIDDIKQHLHQQAEKKFERANTCTLL